MLKRLMNFLMFSTGITPKDHKEPDKYAAIRAKREEWERLQRAQHDANAGFIAMGALGAAAASGDDHHHGHDHGADGHGDHGGGGDFGGGGGFDGGGGGGGGDGGGS